jgi:hypothetical protein
MARKLILPPFRRFRASRFANARIPASHLPFAARFRLSDRPSRHDAPLAKHIAPHVGKNALRHPPRTDMTPQEHAPPPKRPLGTGFESPVSDQRRR